MFLGEITGFLADPRIDRYHELYLQLRSDCE